MVRLYLLGYKGYKTLIDIVNIYGSETINEAIIGKDKNVLNDYSQEIINICEKKSINYISTKQDTVRTDIVSIAIGWRLLIDQNRVKNLIVLHDSILPKYRGFNPLVSALINGDTKIGVTALFASEKYDQGDIIYQSVRKIQYPIKIEKAIELVSENYSDVVSEIVRTMLNNKLLPRKPQNERYATYSLWRDEMDYFINWHLDSEKIERFVDAVGSPYLGANTYVEGERIIIKDVKKVNDIFIENRDVGKIIFFEDNLPVVVCGKGLIKIIKMIKQSDGTEYKVNKIRLRFG